MAYLLQKCVALQQGAIRELIAFFQELWPQAARQRLAHVAVLGLEAGLHVHEALHQLLIAVRLPLAATFSKIHPQTLQRLQVVSSPVTRAGSTRLSRCFSCSAASDLA